MTSTLTEKAVAGRRVTHTRYSDLKKPDPQAFPGIITGTEPGYNGQTVALVRLDGTRCNLHVPIDYAGLTYLDEVVPVPDLPMGRFQPTPDHMMGVWAGVPMSTIGEDGEDLIMLTTDRDKAVAAAQAYDAEYGVHPDSADYDRMRLVWAVFEWEPEDAECPWSVRWDAAEGEDQAIRIYFLPA